MEAEQCRRMAEHYLACARQMTDPGDKAALLEVATYWKRAAEQSENEEQK
jgi:hypothetical protein